MRAPTKEMTHATHDTWRLRSPRNRADRWLDRAGIATRKNDKRTGASWNRKFGPAGTRSSPGCCGASRASADACFPSAPDAATKPVPRERSVLGSGPLGVWTDHTGRGAIEITECAGGLCGHIVWVKDTAHKSECGSQIIGDAKRTSTGAWDGGWIYDPERKARFSVELKPMGSDKLRVMGYQGSKSSTRRSHGRARRPSSSGVMTVQHQPSLLQPPVTKRSPRRRQKSSPHQIGNERTRPEAKTPSPEIPILAIWQRRSSSRSAK